MAASASPFDVARSLSGEPGRPLTAEDARRDHQLMESSPPHVNMDAAMLDIYDRLGVVVMDENRLFGNESAYIANMGAMLKRDRNHASVAIWYFCNTPTLALPLLQP